jgi:hypothetical protein
MTPINRRTFLSTASVAVAAGVACRPQAPPTPPAVTTTDLALEIATHFLGNVGKGRFGLGVDKAAPALWINVYGLAALIVEQDKKSASVVFPPDDHQLKVWTRDPATGKPKPYPVTKSLLISGVKGTSLTLPDSTSLEHPLDSLSLMLDVNKLGAATVAKPVGVKNGASFSISCGQVFAGRAYAGLDLMFRTKAFKDIAEAEAYVDTPTSAPYALTDNFNWLAAADGVPTITIDGTPMSPVIHPNGTVYPVVITNDTDPAAGHHSNKRVLQHSRHYAGVMGLPVGSPLYLPVFAGGQSGETDWEETWHRNSGDPICETFVFWNS